ncbi:MAG: NADH-quinone oxidoreductase subunit A [SAR202 cluster bacterium]|nr:NADH-quinone oxidoreductase subunit A [SAR202 cluster bacterium]|tara:strand:+ start:4173 stop:4541 length:369 start_codon:yes stop_codon:yes gene_type:complete
MVTQTSLNYVPVVVAAIVSGTVLSLLFILAAVVAPKRRTMISAIPYESGIPPKGSTWKQINLRYYLFAVFFLVFDIEAVFLFPWALTYLGIGAIAFFEMVIFLGILFLGLVYAWKKGVLKWT